MLVVLYSVVVVVVVVFGCRLKKIVLSLCRVLLYTSQMVVAILIVCSYIPPMVIIIIISDLWLVDSVGIASVVVCCCFGVVWYSVIYLLFICLLVDFQSWLYY